MEVESYPDDYDTVLDWRSDLRGLLPTYLGTFTDAILSFAETSTSEQSRLTETQLVLSSYRSKELACADRCIYIYSSWLEICGDH